MKPDPYRGVTITVEDPVGVDPDPDQTFMKNRFQP